MKAHQGTLTCITLAAAVFGLTGCQTYNIQNTATPLWKKGKVQEAATEFDRKARAKCNSKDEVVWELEQGAALRAVGRYDESLAALNRAESKMEEYEQAAKTSAAIETEALLCNQAVVPYEGKDYDKVMVSVYKALDYLQTGQFEKARPEFMCAYRRQRDAVEDNKRRIARAQEEINRRLQAQTNILIKTSLDKVWRDPGFKACVTTNYSGVNACTGYADYVNPFAVYADGIYYLCFGAGQSDLERARKSFQRVAAMSGTNRFLQTDLAVVEKVACGSPVPPTTYIVFETGCAPWRDQIRIEIPLAVSSHGPVCPVDAALPTLQFDQAYVPSLTVTAGGVSETTVTIANMDRVVAQSFKDELPSVITKTLLSSAIKAAATYEINKAAERQNPWASFFSQLVALFVQDAINIADTRTWTTLPKEFQVCSVPTPNDRVITLTPATTNTCPVQIQVEPGSINLIYVKSINPAGPLQVQQVKLKSAAPLVLSQTSTP